MCARQTDPESRRQQFVNTVTGERMWARQHELAVVDFAKLRAVSVTAPSTIEPLLNAYEAAARAAAAAAARGEAVPAVGRLPPAPPGMARPGATAAYRGLAPPGGGRATGAAAAAEGEGEGGPDAEALSDGRAAAVEALHDAGAAVAPVVYERVAGPVAPLVLSVRERAPAIPAPTAVHADRVSHTVLHASPGTGRAHAVAQPIGISSASVEDARGRVGSAGVLYVSFENGDCGSTAALGVGGVAADDAARREDITPPPPYAPPLDEVVRCEMAPGPGGDAAVGSAALLQAGAPPLPEALLPAPVVRARLGQTAGWEDDDSSDDEVLEGAGAGFPVPPVLAEPRVEVLRDPFVVNVEEITSAARVSGEDVHICHVMEAIPGIGLQLRHLIVAGSTVMCVEADPSVLGAATLRWERTVASILHVASVELNNCTFQPEPVTRRRRSSFKALLTGPDPTAQLAPALSLIVSCGPENVSTLQQLRIVRCGQSPGAAPCAR